MELIFSPAEFCGDFALKERAHREVLEMDSVFWR
jgi:hypothetical protein